MIYEFGEPGGTELVVIRAADETALMAEMRRLVDFLDRIPTASILDVAYTCALTSGPSAISIIASGAKDLRSRLSSALSRLSSGTLKRIKDKSGTYYAREKMVGEGCGKLAFVYPGVMSFYPDMLRDLSIIYPTCRAAFDELEEAMVSVGEFTPSNFVFPPAQQYRHDSDIFSSGAYAQAMVSVCAGSTALSRLLKKFGLSPDGMVGCVGGDIVAIMQSGAIGTALSRPDRVRALEEIYRIVDRAIDHEGLPSVAMITTVSRNDDGADEVVKTFPPDKFALALDLSPRQKTFAIKPDFEEEAVRAFAAAGVRTLKLALDRPFNTALCEKIVSPLKKFAGRWIKYPSTVDVYSCNTASLLPKKPRRARDETAEGWRETVRFTDTIRQMHADGYRVFLEVGPRGLMSALIDGIIGEEPHSVIALDSIHRRGTLQLQHALAQLASLGASLDLAPDYARRGAKRLDLDAALSLEVAEEQEMPLYRNLPRLTLLDGHRELTGAEFLAEPKGRLKAVQKRNAEAAADKRRHLQFEAGAEYPLISDADELSSTPGVSREFRKTFTFRNTPFICDTAYGASQLSYSDPSLKGLVVLSIPVAAEVMAEAAKWLVPSRTPVAFEDFVCRRLVQFEKDKLTVCVRAERMSSSASGHAAVKVQIREDTQDSEYTWAVMEATVLLSKEMPTPVPAVPDPLTTPRSVHWENRDIYPGMLGFGPRLRGISSADTWGEGGLDYTVDTPPLNGNLQSISFPVWLVNPLLLQDIVSGFALWRSHDRFTGAFSFPFRMRRLDLRAPLPKEGVRLNCYMRLSGVTPQSHLCDITVTGGDGNAVMEISGWEEITSRVPKSLCASVLQPASCFMTETISAEALGNPATNVSSAVITDVPYGLFERNEGFWLKILSHIILNASERRTFAAMKGSVARRTEWLYGRIAAKEAVRRYLKDYHQARWSYADVHIWPNENGKPVPLGEWNKYISAKFDIAIAHTAQFVIAVAASNYRVGVDVESASRDLSEEFARGVFDVSELELAANAQKSSQAIIRFWCAKEAVSKALGTGIRFPPKEMVVTGYDSATGVITLRLTGGWLDAFKMFNGYDITAASRIMRDHAVVTCFIPDSIFARGRNEEGS